MLTSLKSHSLRFTSNPETVKMALVTIAVLTAIASLLFPELALAEGGTGGAHTGG